MTYLGANHKPPLRYLIEKLFKTLSNPDMC